MAGRAGPRAGGVVVLNNEPRRDRRSHAARRPSYSRLTYLLRSRALTGVSHVQSASFSVVSAELVSK